MLTTHLNLEADIGPDSFNTAALWMRGSVVLVLGSPPRSAGLPGLLSLRFVYEAFPRKSCADLSSMVSEMTAMEQAQDTAALITDPERFAVSEHFEEPTGKLEQAIAQLWKDAFQVERVGRDTDFFELGGDSLIAMDLVEKVAMRLDVELSAVTLFQNPTPRQLAQCIALQYSGDNDNSGVPP